MSRCHRSPFRKGFHRTERDLASIPEWLIHHAQQRPSVVILIGLRGDGATDKDFISFGAGDQMTFGNATTDVESTESQEK